MAVDEFTSIILPGIGGVVAGNPAHPTIVLVHGWGGCCLVWRSVLRRLSDRYHIVSLDLPGTGRSEEPSEWSADAMARWALDAVDRLDIDSFALVGHSMGGNVCARVARLAPDRVTALGLVSAAIHSDRLTASQYYLAPVSGPMLMSVSRGGAWFLGVASRMAPDHEAGGFFRPWFRRCGYVWHQNTSPAMLCQLRAITTGPFDLTYLPRSLRVLIVHGRLDSVVPVGHSEEMRKALCVQAAPSRVTMRILPHGRHVPMDDAPEEFARFLSNFLVGKSS